MRENQTPDPPEDAPANDAEEEEIRRERLEDTRGIQPTDSELATLTREQGPPER